MLHHQVNMVLHMTSYLLHVTIFMYTTVKAVHTHAHAHEYEQTHRKIF